jgi:3-hydroxyisobutyrate dehydrogenase-like beta-hydroxyacid dehydrogenase
MGGHLSKGGHEVTVYNRTAAKASKWAKKFGGKTAKTPRDAAKGKVIVFVCVGNDDLRSVVLGDKGALAGMSRGTILVDNTTASANVARELHGIARKSAVGFIDAAVSGGQAGAENGALTVMCGASKTHFNRAEFIDFYARQVTLIGGPGSGQLSKMVNPICIAGLV